MKSLNFFESALGESMVVVATLVARTFLDIFLELF